jgi:transposase-like protein
VAESKPKYWSKLIAEQEAGGQKVRPFCRERGIGEPSFYYWRKRLRKSDTVRFALLETAPADTGSTASALELVLRNGERLRIGNGVDAATFRLVLDAVRR